MSSVFIGIDEKSLRDICRNHIESFESWSRRLINERLKEKYGADFFKSYYQRQGKENDYNVPIFLNVKDSLGNEFLREDTIEPWELWTDIRLRSGDCYKLWVEVDSSFDSSSYGVMWRLETSSFGNIVSKGTGNETNFYATNEMVSYSPSIRFILTQNKQWHRFRKYDDSVEIMLGQILPPIEDVY